MLVLGDRLDAEAVHLYDTASRNTIVSTGRRIEAVIDGTVHRSVLPLSSLLVWGLASRLPRRVLRLDRAIAVMNQQGDGIGSYTRGAIHLMTCRPGGSVRPRCSGSAATSCTAA